MKRKEIVVNGETYKVENEKKSFDDYMDNLKHLTLNDIYGRYSKAKKNAWDYCEALKNKFNGDNLSVSSYNIHIFTCTFDFEHEGKNYMMYITPSYNRVYELV